MNCYQVFVIDAMVPIDAGLEIRYWEYEDIYECVFAETRGQAKSTFWSEPGIPSTCDFIDIRSQLLMKDIDRERGIADWNDPLFDEESA